MNSRWVYPDAGIDGLDLESLVMAGHKAAAEEAPEERHFVNRGGESVEVDPAEEEEAPTFWDVGIIIGEKLWPRRIRADYFEIHEGALWLFVGEGEERGTVAVFAPGWISIECGVPRTEGPAFFESEGVIPETKPPDFGRFIKRSLDSKQW